MHDIIFQKQIGDETELEKGISILTAVSKFFIEYRHKY